MTLFQSFPGVKDVIEKVSIFPVGIKFTAPLVGSKFTFRNMDVLAFGGNPRETYVVDGIALSGTIDELTFSNSIDASFGIGAFSIDIISAGTGLPCTQAPFPFGSYSQALKFAANVRTKTTAKDGRDSFFLRMNGQLNQTADLIAAGINSVTLFATMNVYRCNDKIMEIK